MWLRAWRLATGWIGLALCCGALALLCWTDSAVRNSASLRGYAPPSAEWSLTSEDLPRQWERLRGADGYKAIRNAWPQWFSTFEQRVRFAAGVRPTPDRLRVWLGSRFHGAAGESGMGVCSYPGILPRAAHRVVSPWLKSPKPGIYRFRDIHYAWRDGWLIASDSFAYVDASLNGADALPEPAAADPSTAVVFARERAPQFELAFGYEERLHFAGRLRWELDPSIHPLEIPEEKTLARPLALAMASRDAAGWTEMLRRLPEWTPLETSVLPFLTELIEMSPAAGSIEAERVLQWGYAAGADRTPGIAGASAMGWITSARGVGLDQCLHLPAPLQNTVPMEWGPYEGGCFDLLAEPFCCGGHDGLWLLSTEESLLAAAAERWDETVQKPDGDIALRVVWSGLFDLLVQQGMLAAPRAGAPTRAPSLAALGMLTLEGDADGAWIAFSGEAARQ
jgi:hypothetical protein